MILVAVVLIYVLAEAPLFKLFGNDGSAFPMPHGGVWVVWKPVDWLADNTPLDHPLRGWWGLWGLDKQYRGIRIFREVIRLSRMTGGPRPSPWP
jgi:hypothetical protein